MLLHARAVRGAAAVVLPVLLMLACGDGPTQPPEAERYPAAAVGAVVTGSLTTGTPARTYRLDGSVGDKIRILFQARSGSAADTLRLEVVDSVSGTVLVETRSSGVDTDIEGQATGWLILLRDRSYLIQVTSTGAGDGGGYRFRIDEKQTVIQPGDTNDGEILNPSSTSPEIDVYTFTASAGDEVILFLTGFGGAREAYLYAPDPSAWPYGYMAGFGTPLPGLEENSTWWLELPETGVYTVQVRGSAGPYQLLVYPVNRAPESGPARIDLGAEVTGETIDGVGDIDEYVFAGMAGTHINVLFEVEEGAAGHLDLGVDNVTVWGAWPGGTEGGLGRTGRLELPTDMDYTLRVEGVAAGIPGRDSGPYRFQLLEIDQAPETEPAAVSLGTRVAGESLDVPGDVDEFVFQGEPGVDMNVIFDVGHSTEEDPMSMAVLAPDGTALRYATAGSATERITMLEGEYTIRVAMAVPYSPYAGPYEFELMRVNRAPETAAPTFEIGEVVTGESHYPVGDVDEFTFHGREGQEVTVFARHVGGGTEEGVSLWLDHLGLLEVYAGCVEWGDCQLWRVALPDDGEHRIIVDGNYGGQIDSLDPIEYEFLVFPIDRAPESISADIAIGDTISGETIDPAGDLDEFFFTADADDRLKMFLESVSAPYQLVVYDAASGERLAGVGAGQDDPHLNWFTIPAAGVYRVEIGQPGPSVDGTGAVAAYRFSIHR
jgi:hypothetical protein